MGTIKCVKCGRIVWDTLECPLVSAHGAPPLFSAPRESESCSSERPGPGCGQVYSFGEALPSWAMSAVDESGWLSGRLTCECGSSLGRFDFVNERRCACGDAVLPPMSLSVKKIDVVFRPKQTLNIDTTVHRNVPA